MKKILLGLLSLSVGASLLSSCYEDKGNYTYNFDGINSIDSLSFIPEAYESFNGVIIDFMKSGDPDTTVERVIVNPKFTVPERAEDMDYYWYRRYTWNNQTVIDTVCTPGYMDVKIPGNGNVSYNVILEIRDRTTDISYFTQLTVKTREWYTNSLFVLHGNSVNNMRLGNVEFLGSEPSITLDAFERANRDENLHEPFRNARLLGYRVSWSTGAELLVFKTDGTAEVYNPFGLKRSYDTYFVMPPYTAESNLFVARNLLNFCPSESSTRFRAVTSNDGRFYISSSYFRFFEPGTEAENSEHLTPDLYRVSTGVMNGESYVFWDELGKRFIHTSAGNNYFPWSPNDGRETASMYGPVLDSKVDPSVLSSLRDLQPVYAYVNNFYYFQMANEMRFLFYNPSTQRNVICELSSSGGGKDEKGGDGKGEESASAYQASLIELPEVSIAPGTPIVYTGAYTLDFFFYADGSTVYRYNVQNGDKDIIYEAPAGYTVSLLKFRQNEDYAYWGNLHRYLTIGLNRGTDGAVAEIKLTPAGDLDEAFEPQLYTGFDNIVDVQFCNELRYTIE